MTNPAFREAPVGTACHRPLGESILMSMLCTDAHLQPMTNPAFADASGETASHLPPERRSLCRAGITTKWSASSYEEGRSALREWPESSPLPGPRSPLSLPTIRVARTPAPIADTKTQTSATDTGTASLVPYATLLHWGRAGGRRARLGALRSHPPPWFGLRTHPRLPLPPLHAAFKIGGAPQRLYAPGLGKERRA